MPRVKIDLWMWLSRELGPEFQAPSPMRSILETDVPEGTTARSLFETLAERHPAIRRMVFADQGFASALVLALNGRHVNPAALEERVLEDGDSISVVPMYAGG